LQGTGFRVDEDTVEVEDQAADGFRRGAIRLNHLSSLCRHGDSNGMTLARGFGTIVIGRP